MRFRPTRHRSGSRPSTRPTRRCATRPTGCRRKLFELEPTRPTRSSRSRPICRHGCATCGFRSTPCSPWQTRHERPGDVEAILDRFRDWLEDARVDGRSTGSDCRAGSWLRARASRRETSGSIDLVEEFTALRHELKLQTKSGRGLIEQTETTVAALRQAIEQFRSVEPGEPGRLDGRQGARRSPRRPRRSPRPRRARNRAERDTRFADESDPRPGTPRSTELFRRQSWIRRRLLRSYHQDVIEDRPARRPGARTSCSTRSSKAIGLIQKRLRRALAAEQVAHIPCEGQPVDPELMTVIEVVDEPR